MTEHRTSLSRRQFIAAGAALTAGAIAAPHVSRAQEAATLRITGWGGKWGQVMGAEVVPAFEKEFKCKVVTDTALPFLPKLQASPRSAPIYDVLHTNSNEQWAAVEMGLVEPKIDAKLVPNIADVYPYAVSDKIVGVSIFTSAIGLGMRTDKDYPTPTSWKDLWDARYNGVRGGYVIPVNSLGQAFVPLCGMLYGKGPTDLDAAYAALEKIKPIKLVDFTGAMEKMLLSGEVGMCVLHDSGVNRYYDDKPPTAFVAPKEGVLSLEQVLTITPGSKVKELANAYVNYMLSPDVQKKMAQAVWYSPSNKTVKLDEPYASRLLTTPEKVASLIQVDWKWYNAHKDAIDTRVNRIFRG
ncbi:ABC transporter substrate-binding protein [Azorhizobium oxalatiphilum]|uniref:ABC transporter substrate-binding protein n=1 Tax=Azorhizobium oxalatiphilum TaxID=980631 RepID=A0A917C3P0_9HYPH|nr:ABC transporter substrate-binding protein [Azorhizobium oxalatiphilum]GGF70815.1 ABC transporter substrate-binding protein [Azorhizobium oxalatiphilum]